MRGPATETDELALPPSTEHLRRAGYTVRRTQPCPSFHHGNCLVLDEAPSDLAPWIERFRAELPGVRRLHLEWEGTGLARDEASVNRLGVVRSPDRPGPFELRPLREDDWPAQMALAIASVEERFPGSRPYGEWRNAEHRAQVALGRARWWGAFDGARLIASAGLYESDRWARFQNVLTTPSHRGRGACTTLVHAMCVEVAARRPSREVVLIATRGTQAARIYQRVGFEEVGTQFELSRPLEDDR